LPEDVEAGFLSSLEDLDSDFESELVLPSPDAAVVV
jgi:hypothetical protein